MQNIFWEMPRLDPYEALCFDRLHANHIGLFGDHLWAEFQLAVDELERDVRDAIDVQYVYDLLLLLCDIANFEFCNRMSLFPRWRGLNHFNKVMHIDFTDGSKWEDIAKVCLHVNATLWV